MNSKAKPALRSGVELAARTSWERFTSTVSPAEKGFDGVKVSVWSPFEKAMVPVAVPVERPKTRKLDELIDEVCNAWSKVTEIVVSEGAKVCRTGTVDTTFGGAARAACGAVRLSARPRMLARKRLPLSMCISPPHGDAFRVRAPPGVGVRSAPLPRRGGSRVGNSR